MKIRGGYLPKIAGRPADELETVPCPEELSLDLLQNGIQYLPLVESGSSVSIGQSVAASDVTGGQLLLPAPAAGVVTIEESDGVPARLLLKCANKSDAADLGKLDPSAVTAEAMQNALTKGGVWQSIWSSSTSSAPLLGESPSAIIISLSLKEPFRASSEVVWNVWEERIKNGIAFLESALPDSGTLNLVFAEPDAKAVTGLKALCDGKSKARFHQVPLRYPVENPILISRQLKREDSSIAKDASVWVMDLQTLAAVGACLSEGAPSTQRIIAAGGPANSNPKHFLATIGTPITKFLGNDSDKLMVLRGGIFNGMPVDLKSASVSCSDDALFSMPSEGKPEMFAFINPGFNRRSIYPTFISRLTGAADSHLSGTIRGEHRPCVACSSCEKVCPADLMPQALHRLLYGEEFDDAEALGLELCIDCGACTYVCPSKIDLNTQFAEARRVIAAEKEAALALSAATEKAEETAE